MEETRFTEYPIREIAEYTTKEYPETERPSRIDHLPCEDDQAGSHDDREYGQEDGQISADIESSSTIGRVIERENAADQLDRIAPFQEGDCPRFAELVDSKDGQ